MMRKINRLIVKYNGLIVGYLVQIDEERIAFQYDEKWLNEGFSISPFSLPLSNKLYINSKDTFNGLYGVFFDSLPDGWGELVTRRRLFKRGINYDRLSSLQKLYLVSGRGLGGLSYEPCEDLEILSSEFNSDDFAKEVERF